MKTYLKSLCCACGIFCILGVAGCSQGADKPASTEETKKFQGGGTMTPAEAAAAKMPSGAPPNQGAN